MKTLNYETNIPENWNIKRGDLVTIQPWKYHLVTPGTIGIVLGWVSTEFWPLTKRGEGLIVVFLDNQVSSIPAKMVKKIE